jgi:hypothetical protein
MTMPPGRAESRDRIEPVVQGTGRAGKKDAEDEQAVPQVPHGKAAFLIAEGVQNDRFPTRGNDEPFDPSFLKLI